MNTAILIWVLTTTTCHSYGSKDCHTSKPEDYPTYEQCDKHGVMAYEINNQINALQGTNFIMPYSC